MDTEKSQKVMNERGRHKILHATSFSITAWSWNLRGKANLEARIGTDAEGRTEQTKKRLLE